MNTPIQNPFISPSPTNDSRNASGSGTITAHSRTGLIITFALAQGLLLMGAILSYLTLEKGGNGHNR